MRRTISRRALPVLVVLAALAGGYALRHTLARKALVAVAAQAGGERYAVALGTVDLDPFRGRIRIADLRITPRAAAHADGSPTFTVQARTIDLSKVDLFALLWDRHLMVGHMIIDAPEVTHVYETRRGDRTSRARDTDTVQLPMGVEFLHVDTLRITHARGSTHDRSGVNPHASVADLDILLTGLLMAQRTGDRPWVRLVSGDLSLRGADARVDPFYTAHIDSLHVRVPENTARVLGFRFTPDVRPDHYRTAKEAPMELYTVHADSILLDGFDLTARLESGALLAEVFTIAGLRVDIHRDKSVPYTEERSRAPLPAERVRRWRVPVAMEQVHIRGGRITYHERLARGEPFGSVTLAQVDAAMSGLTNMRPDSSTELHLTGHLRLWDKAPAQVDIHQSHSAQGARIEGRVHLKNLQARELNHITDELVRIQATEGSIHSVDLHMQGDDRSAQGTVHMHYEGLKLKVEPARPHAGLLSLLANAVIHSSNVPGDRRYRVGRSFVHRRQETSVFNYLWLSLREGMLDVLLPDPVLERLHTHQAR